VSVVVCLRHTHPLTHLSSNLFPSELLKGFWTFNHVVRNNEAENGEPQLQNKRGNTARLFCDNTRKGANKFVEVFRAMKKIRFLALTLVAILAMGAVVMANPGQNPNQNPGGPEMDLGAVTITVTGGGNNLVIRAIHNETGATVIVPRAGNGTWTQSFTVFTFYDVTIWVQGNSLVRYAIVDNTPLPNTPTLPGNPQQPGGNPFVPPIGQLPPCLNGDDPDLCPAPDFICTCEAPPAYVATPWTGAIPVQGGNNGRILVTVNGQNVEVRGNLAQQAGTRTFTVNGIVFRVTANDNNFVTGVSATIDGVAVSVTNVVSLTPGTGNSQN